MRFASTLFGLVTLAACGQVLDKDRTNYLTLRREYQLVRHYGCEGEVVSERRREVGEPAAWVRVRPSEKIDPQMVGYSDFKVVTTGDTNGMTSDLFSFYVHSSDTVLGYRVNAGKNQVKYSFWGCRKWSSKRDGKGRAICLEKGSLLETGFVELDVALDEGDRDVAQEIRPAAVVCAETGPSAPSAKAPTLPTGGAR